MPNESKVLIWDIPTRVFHWLFATSFAVAWLTHESSRLLDVHVFAGCDAKDAAELAGRDVAAWEQFWLELLREYEHICDELLDAA